MKMKSNSKSESDRLPNVVAVIGGPGPGENGITSRREEEGVASYHFLIQPIIIILCHSPHSQCSSHCHFLLHHHRPSLPPRHHLHWDHHLLLALALALALAPTFLILLPPSTKRDQKEYHQRVHHHHQAPPHAHREQCPHAPARS